MLSVRLPEPLNTQLNEYCGRTQTSKSTVVFAALDKHLKSLARDARRSKDPISKQNPFTELVGTGNGRYTTEALMRMTRGDDWNQP